MLIRFPPQLGEWQEKYLLQEVQEWCLANSLILIAPPYPGSADGKDKGLLAQHAPVTLFPSPFSKSGFDEALSVQQSFHTLYHAVVKQERWLLDVLTKGVAPHDDFTRKLIEIHKETVGRRTQTLTGGLFRSDYIVNRVRTNDEGRQIKQVEFNTVSVSFGALATKVSQLHRYLASTNNSMVHGTIPESNALSELANGLFQMHRAYNASANRPLTSGAILMIVQPHERNRIDQRLLEFELFETHGVIMYRVTLEQVLRQVRVGENNRLSFLPSGHEVTVVYYRAGYGPSDYPTDKEWEARRMLESSHAIQCPSVLTQLSGSKKIQQLLTDDNIVDNLIQPGLPKEQLDQLRRTFVKIYPLDNSELGLQGRKLALEHPMEYVLKPQREGGGNNIYRDAIPGFLQSIPEKSWDAYILMELIEPPKISNRIVKGGEIVSGRVVNELGVFGAVLWDLESGQEVMNTQAGWLLRTKLQESDEGGIAAGFGCLDAVLLPSKR